MSVKMSIEILIPTDDKIQAKYKNKISYHLTIIISNNNKLMINIMIIISTDEDPCLRIESFAIMNLRGVSTKLNKCIVFTMQTYKEIAISTCARAHEK